MNGMGCCGQPLEGFGAAFYSNGRQVPQYGTGVPRPPWPERPGVHGYGAVSEAGVWRNAYGLASLAGAVGGAYHGYKRNRGSIGWAVGWSIFGSFLPFLSLPISVAQGFGKPAH